MFLPRGRTMLEFWERTDSHHHELVETLKLFKWIQFGRVGDMTKYKVIAEISIIMNYGPRVSQIRALIPDQARDHFKDAPWLTGDENLAT